MHKTITSFASMPHVNGRNGESPTDALPSMLGLIVTCSADCFPPEILASRLSEGDWLIHRAAAAIVPPFGVADRVEQQFIEHAIVDRGVRHLVVCGHDPCASAARLLRPDGRSDDRSSSFSCDHVQAIRRVLAALPERNGRIAAERAVLAQTANLLTHPSVAAAVATGRLTLKSWLYDAADGELLYPTNGDTRFTRPAALHPLQNAGLRREFVHRDRPREPIWVFDRRRLELA